MGLWNDYKWIVFGGFVGLLALIAAFAFAYVGAYVSCHDGGGRLAGALTYRCVGFKDVDPLACQEYLIQKYTVPQGPVILPNSSMNWSVP